MTKEIVVTQDWSESEIVIPLFHVEWRRRSAHDRLLDRENGPLLAWIQALPSSVYARFVHRVELGERRHLHVRGALLSYLKLDAGREEVLRLRKGNSQQQCVNEERARDALIAEWVQKGVIRFECKSRGLDGVNSVLFETYHRNERVYFRLHEPPFSAPIDFLFLQYQRNSVRSLARDDVRKFEWVRQYRDSLERQDRIEAEIAEGREWLAELIVLLESRISKIAPGKMSFDESVDDLMSRVLERLRH